MVQKFHAGIGSGAVRLVCKAREEFEASKALATFPLDGAERTLILDGKIEDCLGSRMVGHTKLIQDIREVATQAQTIRQACLQAKADFAFVDLGTQESFYVLPETSPRTGEIESYELLNSGAQRIGVTLQETGGLDLCIRTTLDHVSHSMRARVEPDGTVDPYAEGLSWRLAR